MVMWDNLTFAEKSDVFQLQYVGPSFFFVGCSAKIFAGPHCKKYCTDTELSDGDVLYGGSFRVKFAEDGEGECFLLHDVGVLIFVASVLLL